MSIQDNKTRLALLLVMGDIEETNKLVSEETGSEFSLIAFAKWVVSEGLVSPVVGTYQRVINNGSLNEQDTDLVLSDLTAMFGE